MITFKGKYLHTMSIPKIKDNIGAQRKVAFVELLPGSEEDINTMTQISKEWGWIDSFANNIRMSMLREILQPNLQLVNTKRFFALTTQEDKFDKLDYLQILGVAELENASNEQKNINYLQVNPDHAYGSAQAEYKNIGKSLLKGILNIHQDGVEFVLNSVSSSCEFYEKLGFNNTTGTRIYRLIKR